MPPSRKQQSSGPTSAKPAKNTSKKQKAKDDDRPNIAKVVLGEQVMVPLYKSPYPVDLVGEKPEMLYVCEFCFKYTTDISKYLGHRKFCEIGHGAELPGTFEEQIDREHSIYRVDAETDGLFCSNMCLFAKLFMHDKSIYFDLKGFIFYTVVKSIDDGISAVPGIPMREPLRRVVGFFSKEKMSWDDFNLACILVFEPFLRCGLGTKMIEYSYRLSKREGKPGSPEKPMSDLGKLTYHRYWRRVISGVLLNPDPKRAATTTQKEISIADISKITMITPEDILEILGQMEAVVKRPADGQIIISISRVEAFIKKEKVAPAKCTYLQDIGDYWYR